MRVVIDGRKITDYGIGTYIRGLLRGLQELGTSDEYIVLAPENARELIPFEHVVADAPKYSLREIVAIGTAVRRLRADVFHAPHYVIPVTSTPTVVTIHDLIHLHLRNPVKRTLRMDDAPPRREADGRHGHQRHEAGDRVDPRRARRHRDAERRRSPLHAAGPARAGAVLPLRRE